MLLHLLKTLIRMFETFRLRYNSLVIKRTEPQLCVSNTILLIVTNYYEKTLIFRDRLLDNTKLYILKYRIK